jgi:hypothetical protein
VDNLLLSQVDYKVTETPRGVWRRYMYPNGLVYSEFTSNTTVLGLPLLHFTSGRSPETGTFTVARGFIAVGRRAFGVVALGRVAAGVLAIGHASIGLVALGQAALGLAAVGQLALGLALGIGQVATGTACIAQFGVGRWVLAQLGFGQHVWSMRLKDPEAIEFFKSLAGRLWRAGSAG